MADEQVFEKENENERENQPVEQAQAETAPSAEDALRKELEAAQAKAAEYLDGWQRARAEFANYKKRVEADRADTYQNAASAVLARYLSVLDDFDRAMKDMPKEGDAAQWAEGIALIHRKFQNTLEAEGVAAIKTEGETFNPSLHEAVTHEESDGHKEGEIIDELRKGYRIGDRVLRPALVRVAK